MQVHLELYAALMRYLPPGADRHRVTVDIEPGSLSFRLWQHTHSGRFAPQPVMRHARLVASNARS